MYVCTYSTCLKLFQGRTLLVCIDECHTSHIVTLMCVCIPESTCNNVGYVAENQKGIDKSMSEENEDLLTCEMLQSLHLQKSW